MLTLYRNGIDAKVDTEAELREQFSWALSEANRLGELWGKYGPTLLQLWLEHYSNACCAMRGHDAPAEMRTVTDYEVDDEPITVIEADQLRLFMTHAFMTENDPRPFEIDTNGEPI